MITTTIACISLAIALLSLFLVVRLYILANAYAKTVNTTFTDILRTVNLISKAYGEDNKAVVDLKNVMQDILDIATTPSPATQYTVNSKANKDAN